MRDDGGGRRRKGGWLREVGFGRRGERLSLKEEGRGGGSELYYDLDLDPDGKYNGSGSGNTALFYRTKI